jgi:hypothetical protein
VYFYRDRELESEGVALFSYNLKGARVLVIKLQARPYSVLVLSVKPHVVVNIKVYLIPIRISRLDHPCLAPGYHVPS